MDEAPARLAPLEPTIGPDGIPDFTIVRKSRPFRIDGDVFEAVSATPMLGLLDLAGVQARLNQADTQEARTKVILDVFGRLLLPDSLTRFTERLGSWTEPIDPAQFAGVLRHLIAAYAGRPTTQPSGSSTGSVSLDGGMPSMAAPSAEALTSSDSPQTGS